MMSGNNISWTVLSLDDVASFQNGGAWKESEYEESGVPVVRVTNCKGGTIDLNDCKYLNPASFEKYSKHELSQGDVVIATVGSHPTQPNSVVGRSSIVPHKAAGSLLNQNAVRLRAKKGIFNQKLLGYISQSGHFKQYIAAHARGAASQVRMSIELLKKMPIKVPPLGTQESIASILSAYDDLIENNTRRIEILEEMARRLYEEWFVHFRFPGHESAKFKDSELGRIPEGWKVKGLYDIAEVTYGHPFKAKQFNDQGEGLGAVRIRDIRGGQVKTYTTEEGKPKHIIENGDILVGMDGQFHMGKWPGGRAWLVQRVARFRPIPPMSRYLLFLSLQGPIKHLEETIVGTTVAHLSAKDLSSMKVLVPDDDTLSRMTDALDPMYALEISLQRKNRNLRTQRDLLLPKLVSGEIDVSSIPMPDDKEIEAA